MMTEDTILIQVPYCDEEGTMHIAIHKMFCGAEGCHSIHFELRDDKYWCKKCGALKTYRVTPEEEKDIFERDYETKIVH